MSQNWKCFAAKAALSPVRRNFSEGGNCRVFNKIDITFYKFQNYQPHRGDNMVVVFKRNKCQAA